MEFDCFKITSWGQGSGKVSMMTDEVVSIEIQGNDAFPFFWIETRPGVPQYQAQGLVFCPWLGSS